MPRPENLTEQESSGEPKELPELLEEKEESLEEKGLENKVEASRRRREFSESPWIKCCTCGKLIYKPRMEEKLFVCPECNFHFEIPSSLRVATMVDPDSFEEKFAGLEPVDALNFFAQKSYKDRLEAAQKQTGLKDACIIGTARMDGMPVVFGVSDSRFLRGSMGAVVGEKICRGVELAGERKVPFIFVSGSGGGARMDEGILSLMQMAKTSAAVAHFHAAGGLFISILTNPTMGGAMASFAALGDVTIAEPKALIGFAGPNVIRQTIRSEIPAGFQTSEFLLEHGFIDLIVERANLRLTVIRLLKYFSRDAVTD
ncbi:MAG: acetyl-CoA carboxylase carboxyltransferase subunit beta [Planctomycetes bacterium]|nr:acetyl-CoA carboxylase carboxyltransferase subunit beta [Planctomycetota bacterium]